MGATTTFGSKWVQQRATCEKGILWPKMNSLQTCQRWHWSEFDSSRWIWKWLLSTKQRLFLVEETINFFVPYVIVGTPSKIQGPRMRIPTYSVVSTFKSLITHLYQWPYSSSNPSCTQTHTHTFAMSWRGGIWRGYQAVPGHGSGDHERWGSRSLSPRWLPKWSGTFIWIETDSQRSRLFNTGYWWGISMYKQQPNIYMQYTDSQLRTMHVAWYTNTVTYIDI